MPSRICPVTSCCTPLARSMSHAPPTLKGCGFHNSMNPKRGHGCILDSVYDRVGQLFLGWYCPLHAQWITTLSLHTKCHDTPSPVILTNKAVPRHFQIQVICLRTTAVSVYQTDTKLLNLYSVCVRRM